MSKLNSFIITSESCHSLTHHNYFYFLFPDLLLEDLQQAHYSLEIMVLTISWFFSAVQPWYLDLSSFWQLNLFKVVSLNGFKFICPPTPERSDSSPRPKKKRKGRTKPPAQSKNKEICNCIYINNKKKREERTKLVPPNKEICNIIYPVFLDHCDEWKSIHVSFSYGL